MPVDRSDASSALRDVEFFRTDLGRRVGNLLQYVVEVRIDPSITRVKDLLPSARRKLNILPKEINQKMAIRPNWSL